MASPDADGNGVRERAGEAFRFALLVSGGLNRRAGVFIQNQLRELGVQIEVIEQQTYWQRVLNGEFDAAIIAIHPAGGVGHDVFFGAESVLGYDNPAVVRLLGQAAGTLDPDEIDGAYRELMPIFEAELPITSLHPDVRTTAAHRRVRGLSSPHRAEPAWHVDDMWIEGPP